MKITIGLDIGGSITKIIGFKDECLIGTLKVKAEDRVTSAYGAFGKFLKENNLKISDISDVALTGVGASLFSNGFFGIKTEFVDEFDAVGEGGRFVSSFNDAIIVSMGTGTAFIRAKADGSNIHIGGSGVGGGTVQGLASQMLGVRKFQNIIQLASKGDLTNIDLTIGDISDNKINNMPKEITASNFGKISDLASNEDLALGIVNMVFQTIGMMAIFAARSEGIKNIVLTGNLSIIPFVENALKMLEDLHNVRFIIPQNGDFATAIGAALCRKKMH